jgi:hypothetical protein
MNFAIQVLQEELQHARGADGGGRRGDNSEWGLAFNRRQSKLNNLFAAALAEAERTGFPITEVERRLRGLQIHTLDIMLWPVRARAVSDEKRQPVEASGCWWGGPVSDYLQEHTGRRSRRALAINQASGVWYSGFGSMALASVSAGGLLFSQFLRAGPATLALSP